MVVRNKTGKVRVRKVGSIQGVTRCVYPVGARNADVKNGDLERGHKWR